MILKCKSDAKSRFANDDRPSWLSDRPPVSLAMGLASAAAAAAAHAHYTNGLGGGAGAEKRPRCDDADHETGERHLIYQLIIFLIPI